MTNSGHSESLLVQKHLNIEYILPSIISHPIDLAVKNVCYETAYKM